MGQRIKRWWPRCQCLKGRITYLAYWFRSCLTITTVTSQWARWRLKSPASPLFTQPFIQAQIKENIKALRHWLCAEKTPETGEFPAQLASNAENVSIWGRHHVDRIAHSLDHACMKFPLSATSTNNQAHNEHLAPIWKRGGRWEWL